MAKGLVENPFISGAYSCTGGTGVTSSVSVRVYAKCGIMAGYLQVTSARSQGDVIVNIPRTLAGSTVLALINNTDHTGRIAYANADGTITAAGGIPTGYYNLVGAVIFS